MSDPRHPPGRLEIVRAIPGGSRRARDQRSWLRAVTADPAIAELRSDARRTVLELARVLARHADWHARTTWRPRALACAEIGSSRDPSRPLSITAYKAARRVLQECGYLGLVSQGWTSSLRAAVLDDGTSVSAVFVMTIPRQKPRLPPPSDPPRVNRPLTRPRSGLLKPPHAREAQAGMTTSERAPRALPDVPPTAREWPTWKNPKSSSEGLAAADVVRHRARILGRLSREHWRSIVRAFIVVGWTPGDVLYALDHSPGGRRHGFTAEPRHVAGWARYRLGLWLDPQHMPLRAPSQLRAAEHEQLQARQAQRRAERARASQAAAADVRGHAALARAMLQGRGRVVSPPLVPEIATMDSAARSGGRSQGSRSS